MSLSTCVTMGVVLLGEGFLDPEDLCGVLPGVSCEHELVALSYGFAFLDLEPPDSVLFATFLPPG